MYSPPQHVTRKFLRFASRQPPGYLSSWPLFALSHHLLVWIAAEREDPGRRFTHLRG